MLKSLALFILILCTTLVVTHSRVIQASGTNIVQQICSKTPNPALCIQYLNADPKSSTSDVKGLAQIMFNVLKSKASIAIDKIIKLTITIPPKQKEALLYCSIDYTSVLIEASQGTQALQNGDPSFAVDNANYVTSEANGCENGFSGKSPLTVENNLMRDASTITSAICKLLL
ncbi:cell wall / vacuolar inhibitor of fructosidase 1-like [Vicia villosa]|uniref:cell wall / vacuolar inhibitor of fructosidase 1-like n=1 Tax=Vicia villosa TaxID=3911 RepID=UPI00273BF474|nr:cell wall / vacuolar inhibitor of fructosidase 1-like [Vicia villosa]